MLQIQRTPGMKILELGGGANPVVHPRVLGGEDVNADVRPCHDAQGRQTVDFIVDLNEPLPISTDEWDLVVSVFAFEHVSWRKIPQLLGETFRILKPGGKLLLVLPNTEAQMKYIQDHPEGWEDRDLFTSASITIFGDQNYKENSHSSWWSPLVAMKLLTTVGFEDVLTRPYGAIATDMVVEAHKPLEDKWDVEEKHMRTVEWDREQTKYLEKRLAKPVLDLQEPSAQPPKAASVGFRLTGEEEVKVTGSNSQSIEPVPLFTEKPDFDSKEPSIAQDERQPESNPDPLPEGESSILEHPEPLKTGEEFVGEGVQVGNLPFQPVQVFNRRYFDAYQGRGFYWDYPFHELQARHVLARNPESVLELGSARGYVLKRIQNAGVRAQGLEVSKHCQLTQVCDGIISWDCWKTPWPIGNKEFDLLYCQAFWEHVPEELFPDLLREVGRVSKRGLHGITFDGHSDDSDPTRVNIKPRSWWEKMFRSAGLSTHELVERDELNRGEYPQEVFEGDGRLKVQIGSAWTMFHHGWQNLDTLDLTAFAQANNYQFKRCDARNGLPYGTGVVDRLYLSHVLEHLTEREGSELLKELRRVIRPDGCLRILVPDAGLLTGSYLGGGGGKFGVGSLTELNNFDEVNQGCAEAKTWTGKLWALLCQGHAACYDANSLGDLLDECGWVAQVADPFAGTPDVPGSEQIVRECINNTYGMSLVMDAKPKLG